ncbi:MAG: type II toxin-antitoxin system HicA family toxin [Ginsengibacter sp.]
MKTREIIKIIEADGWYEVRQSGSHRQYKHTQKKGLVTIPIHRLSNDLTPGLEKSILKQVQLDKK